HPDRLRETRTALRGIDPGSHDRTEVAHTFCETRGIACDAFHRVSQTTQRRLPQTGVKEQPTMPGSKSRELRPRCAGDRGVRQPQTLESIEDSTAGSQRRCRALSSQPESFKGISAPLGTLHLQKVSLHYVECELLLQQPVSAGDSIPVSANVLE